jgi:diguanylate cyclase (GGDEF)-like protein
MLEVRLLYKKLEDSNQVLKSLALHDSLTGLPNRRLLMDRLSLAIAHAYRYKHTMALLYLDLDKFKPVNDTFGHTTGDILLRMVADRVVNSVRQEDTVARLGGDEFVIVLWKLSDTEDADKLASKVIDALSKPFIIQGLKVSITVSIGVSIYPMHGGDGNTLMKSADLALIGAKLAGKNNYFNAAPTELLMNG